MDVWLITGTVLKRCQGGEHSISTETDEVEDSVATTSDRGSLVSQVCTAATVCCKRRKMIRKYDQSYLGFGFSWNGTERDPTPQWVVCGDVISNESMKPAHPKRHLTTKHAVLKDKPIVFIQRKLDELKQSKAIILSGVTSVAKEQ